MLSIDSISHLCELLGCEKPRHPLIAAIDYKSITSIDKFIGNAYVQNFYGISLKNGVDCELKYGQATYDFTEGSLVFTAPSQILSSGEGKIQPSESADGWMLCIHPDLIKGTSLWRRMCEYSFFAHSMLRCL